jgi:hypothetical protein
MKQSAKATAAIVGVAMSIALAAPQALANGGLSISPSVVEGGASRGVIGSVSVSNTSSVTMKIMATVRPWAQASNGAVTPNAHRVLSSEIRLSRSAFSLAAGQKQTITLTLLRTPPDDALYGNIDVIGVPPTNKARNGVTVSYRLIGSVRVLPSKAREKFSAGATAVRQSGSGSRREVSVGIRNTGNTIDPISGTFHIQGALASVNGDVSPETIVPGATVFAPLTHVRGQLPRGSYTATLTLKQNGSTILKSARRKFKVS